MFIKFEEYCIKKDSLLHTHNSGGRNIDVSQNLFYETFMPHLMAYLGSIIVV